MSNNEPIRQFKGRYRFLSNFYPTKITIDGKEYPSTEHYYQAMKFTDPELREKIQTASSPGKAKKMARSNQPREDWHDISLEVMKRALRVKFNNPKLRQKLLATGDSILQEGNTWGDEFWGVNLNTGEGKNHLGKLLMRLRQEFREEDKT